MASPRDVRIAQTARVHIIAAKAAPHRDAQELTQAENHARLIENRELRETVLKEIRKARGEWG